MHFSIKSRWMRYYCQLFLLIPSINLICFIYDGRRGIYQFTLLSNAWVCVVRYYDGYIPGLKEDKAIQSLWDYEVCFSKYINILLPYTFTHLVVGYLNVFQCLQYFFWIIILLNYNLDFSFLHLRNSSPLLTPLFGKVSNLGNFDSKSSVKTKERL